MQRFHFSSILHPLILASFIDSFFVCLFFVFGCTEEALGILDPQVKVRVAQLWPTLCNPTDYTVHGILQARILEWVAIPFSRGSSQPRNWTQVSHIAGRFLPAEPQGKPNQGSNPCSLKARHRALTTGPPENFSWLQPMTLFLCLSNGDFIFPSFFLYSLVRTLL